MASHVLCGGTCLSVSNVHKIPVSILYPEEPIRARSFTERDPALWVESIL